MNAGRAMWYAIFAGDDCYHLVKSLTRHTLCGLPTLRRDKGGEEYSPPARVLHEQPPVGLYRSCPRCVAESNAATRRGGGQDARRGRRATTRRPLLFESSARDRRGSVTVLALGLAAPAPHFQTRRHEV